MKFEVSGIVELGIIPSEVKLAYRRKWYQKHKEQVKEYVRDWERKNPEKKKEYKKEYAVRHREKVNKLGRDYYYRQKAKNQRELEKIGRTNPVITNLTAKRIRHFENVLKTNRFYSTKNLREILGFSKQWIQELRKQGKIHYWIFEGHVFYPIKFWVGKVEG